MEAKLLDQIKSLSISERILLAEEIWDSVATENKAFDLTPVQIEELDKRMESFRKNPQLGRTWEEIRAEFLGN
jgi:putative addiction module component (TIGR02574 family)